jgi:hypothetical protein
MHTCTVTGRKGRKSYEKYDYIIIVLIYASLCPSGSFSSTGTSSQTPVLGLARLGWFGPAGGDGLFLSP